MRRAWKLQAIILLITITSRVSEKLFMTTILIDYHKERKELYSRVCYIALQTKDSNRKWRKSSNYSSKGRKREKIVDHLFKFSRISVL